MRNGLGEGHTMFQNLVVIVILLVLPSCSSLFYTPKRDIQLLVDPSTINYRCAQSDADTITCRKID